MTDTERKEVELKPCPFCGCNFPEKLTGMGEYWIKCPKCNSSCDMKSNADDCVNAWNKRPQDNNTHKCTCNRHPDSAFTVRVKNEIPYCPRCGGIVWPKIDNNTLVPLDVEKLALAIGEYEIYTTTDNWKPSPRDKAKMICAKFGKDNSGMVPIKIENMREIIFNPGEILKVPKNIQELNDFMDFIFERICLKYGQHPPKERKGE